MYTVTARTDKTSMMNTVTVINATGVWWAAAAAAVCLVAVRASAGVSGTAGVVEAGPEADIGAGRTGKSADWVGFGASANGWAATGAGGVTGAAGFGAATSMTGLVGAEGCISS